MPMYYASTNDTLWDYLKITGRTVDSLVTFIDKYVMMLSDAGVEFNWKMKTWHDLSVAVSTFKRTRPDALIDKTETNESNTQSRHDDERSARFNQLLT